MIAKLLASTAVAAGLLMPAAANITPANAQGTAPINEQPVTKTVNGALVTCYEFKLYDWSVAGPNAYVITKWPGLLAIGGTSANADEMLECPTPYGSVTLQDLSTSSNFNYYVAPDAVSGEWYLQVNGAQSFFVTAPSHYNHANTAVCWYDSALNTWAGGQTVQLTGNFFVTILDWASGNKGSDQWGNYHGGFDNSTYCQP